MPDVYPSGARITILALMAVVGFAGCSKLTGDAIVLEKEHIDAAATPASSPSLIPPGGSDAVMIDQPDDAGTITVDSYVMKPEVRGTDRDPRAFAHEQWLVKVRVIDNGRTFNVPVDQTRFVRLNQGDRVRVRYQVGKYTGTLWGAEIIE